MATKHHLDNPLYIHWKKQIEGLKAWCGQERGRAAAIARLLGVSRQTVNRWINNKPALPAWAWWSINKAHRDGLIESVRLGRDKHEAPKQPTPSAWDVTNLQTTLFSKEE